jgi:hypothetical protein
MRRIAVACSLAGLLTCVMPGTGAAEVVISVDKSKQTMVVLVDGRERYNWVVSTGVGGGPYNGTYRPGRMERKWASRKYGMAPMPYSIFFDGNYAIHGTVKVAQLGRRASKGCVRLHPRDAAVLFELVQREKANTTIVVSANSHVAATKAVAPPVVAPPKVVTPKPALAVAEPPKSVPVKSEPAAVKRTTDGSGVASAPAPIAVAPLKDVDPVVTGSTPAPSHEAEFLE